GHRAADRGHVGGMASPRDRDTRNREAERGGTGGRREGGLTGDEPGSRWPEFVESGARRAYHHRPVPQDRPPESPGGPPCWTSASPFEPPRPCVSSPSLRSSRTPR